MSPVLHPRIWTTILLLLAGAGCAPSLQITHPRPPEIDISGYKKVAVGGIEGEGGSEIQSLLTQALFDSGRFEVLDRAHLGEVIKEQNLSVSDSFAPADAAEVGRLMASTGLVFGEITRRDYKETEYRVKRSCPLGQGGADCYKYCVSGQWDLNVTLRVVDSSTGRIVAVRHVRCARNFVQENPRTRPVVTWDVRDVFVNLSEQAVDEFMQSISPSTMPVQLKVFTAQPLPSLGRGLHFAESGDWDAAIEQFRLACRRADGDPAIPERLRARAHYDLGVALGYGGRNYEEGLRELDRATRIYPEKIFFSEQQRLRALKMKAL